MHLLIAVAAIATIEMGSSSSFFFGPSEMIEVKRFECFLAREPRALLKYAWVMTAMIHAWRKDLLHFVLPL